MVQEQVLNEVDIQLLADLLEQATSEQVYQNINYNQLKTSANNFLLGIKSIEAQENSLSQNWLKQKINDPESISYIKGLRGSKEAYLLRAKYLLAFDFDAQMTSFLQQLPKEALYVYEGKGTIKTFKMSMVELAKRATASGRLRVSLNQLMAENRQAVEDAEKTNLDEQEHLKFAQAAYLGINARLNRFYEKHNLSGAKAQGGLLMWKLGKYWTVARVTNKGDLKEAYAAAIMTEHKKGLDILCSSPVGSPAFYAHELIANFYNGYVSDVTNMAAIVEEDIKTSEGQFGVKSAGASMPSLQQYITVAQWIIIHENIFTKEELQSYIKEAFPMDTHRNTAVTLTKYMTEKQINELLDKVKNTNEIINLF